MNLKDGVKLSLGAILGVVVAVHGTRLVLQLTTRPTKRLPPGPRPWPMFGNDLQLGPSPCRMLAKVCEKYGGVMSLWVCSTPTVVITSPHVAQELFSLRLPPNTFESRPGLMLHHGSGPLEDLSTMGYLRHNNLPSHTSPQWRKLRRILNSYLMSTNKKTSFRPLRESNKDHVLAVMMENLKQEATANKCYVVNARTHLRFGILNLLFTTCFGSVVDLSTGMMDHQLVRLLTAFKDVVRLGIMSKFTDYLPIVRELPATVTEIELAQTAKRAEECCVQSVAIIRKRFHPKDPKKSKLLHSFLDVLCNLHGEERLSDREITWVLTEIMLTATDNTATTVEWALGQLICRPDMQAMIQAEIDRVVGDNKHISEGDIDKMPYLKAVVKETQRANHPVMLTLPHVTTKPLDIAQGMYHLPTGTNVIVHVPALLTDPNIWDDPMDFRPERHFNDLDEHEDPEKVKMQVDILSAVRRLCPGQGLVTHKSQLLLAKILQSFDVLAPFTGKPKPYDESSSMESGVINHMKLPLEASLRPREFRDGPLQNINTKAEQHCNLNPS